MENPKTTSAKVDIDWTERFHAVVDEAAGPALRANASRLACRAGCADCCTDGLTVFSLEAEVIRRHHADLLEHGRPHEPGACAFLDGEGNCRIYEHRPYVCRTQGLPLRWLEEDEETGDIIESRDICPKNTDGTPLEELAIDACWTLGPFEQRLADRQHAGDGDRGERVSLRALFTNQHTSSEHRRLPVVSR